MEEKNTSIEDTSKSDVSSPKTIWRLPSDIEWAIVGLSGVIVSDLNFFLWGFRVYLPCWLSISFPAAMIGVPIAVVYLLFRLARRWSGFSRSQKIIRLSFLAIFAVEILLHLSGISPTDLGMRLNVARTGGIDQLQSWAIDILERPEAEILVDPNNKYSIKTLKKEVLSEQVRTISKYGSFVYLRSTPQGRYVNIVVGGGGFIEFDWGIILSSPDMKVEEHRKVSAKWRDGVYAY